MADKADNRFSTDNQYITTYIPYMQYYCIVWYSISQLGQKQLSYWHKFEAKLRRSAHNQLFHTCCDIPYNGNNLRKKMFTNWQLFLIHEKTFANGDNPSQVHEYLASGTITYIAACHSHFSNEFYHCRSSTKQYVPMQQL